MNEHRRSRRFVRCISVLVPGLVAAALFLAGEGRHPRAPSDLAAMAAEAFAERDRDLTEALGMAAAKPDDLVQPAEKRALVFERLAALLGEFPPGTGLELFGTGGALEAWSGAPRIEDRADPERLGALLHPSGQDVRSTVMPSGIFLLLGKSAGLQSGGECRTLVVWHSLDVVDPALRPYFPGPFLAEQLSADLGTRVQIGLPSQTGEKGAIPAYAHGDSPPRKPVASLYVEPESASPGSAPGPVTAFLGGLALLLALIWGASFLFHSDRPSAPLRFMLFLALCVGVRFGFWALDFPGCCLGGDPFDPFLFHVRSLIGPGETAGDFLVSALFATAITLAFLKLVPPSVHALTERSKVAATLALLVVPFSVPLLSLALSKGVAEIVAGASVGGFIVGSPVDLFPAGSITLRLPATLILVGFFLFALCFALLGASAIHVLFRTLRRLGERRAALLAFMMSASAGAVLLWGAGWNGWSIFVPVVVLLLLHLVHLKLRHEGTTALHVGVFLLAAACAAFPALLDETQRAKSGKVEELIREVVGTHDDLRNRIEETVRLAGTEWHAGISTDSPFLPFMLWAKSPLALSGISSQIRLKLKKSARYGSTFLSGSLKDIAFDPQGPRNRIVPVSEADPRWRGVHGFYIGNAFFPDLLGADILAFWNWPDERPSFPPLAAPGPGLAFARYEQGQLVQTTKRVPLGRHLPQAVGTNPGEKAWVRESHDWGSALTLYVPGPGKDVVLGAALPVAPVWGDILGFLRLFLFGVLCAAAAFGIHGLWKAARSRSFQFHRRLKYRLIGSFALISIIPIFVLGYYTEAETVERIRKNLKEEAEKEIDLLMGLLREEVRIQEMRGGQVDAPGFSALKIELVVDDQILKQKAKAIVNEWDLYLSSEEGEEPGLAFSSRMEAVENLLIARRLPPEAYRKLYLGGETYHYDLERWGGFWVVRGFHRFNDRNYKPLGVLATSRFLPAWMFDATVASEVSLILSLYLLSLVAVGFLGLFLARRLAFPLEKLTEATRALAAGDLDYRVPPYSKDEIGDLIESFNLMTAQLSESREAMVRAEKESAWREMARQIAHEIKNPLTPMKLSAQHIVRAHRDGSDRFDEILGEGTRRIIEQIDALGRIAQEFSDFARFPKRDLKPLELNRLLREAVRLISEEAGGAGAPVEFREHYQEDLPLVTADEDEIRRMAINLLRNAIQAMAESGGVVTVSTRLEEPGRRREGGEKKKGKTRVMGTKRKIGDEVKFAEVIVSDTGSGIPEALKDKLFQPYFSTKSGGTGLGLAICKKAVDEMGGEILIESEEGRGTAVIVRLPLGGWDSNLHIE